MANVSAETTQPVALQSSAGKQAGTSLTQDAWRRLRKNRVAMLSLAALIAIVVLAGLTPLLPLAPPDHIQTSLKLTPPSGPLFTSEFAFDPQRVTDSYREAAEMAPEIAAAYAAIDAAAIDDAPDGDDRTIAEAKYRRLVTTQEGLIQRPYREVGYPNLGWLPRSMVRLRHMVFGDLQFGPLFGRDKLGRDILSRVFWGGRVSLIVGFVATLVSLVIGVTYGMVSGYLGGWVDDAMMRFVDVLYSIPFIFVVIFIITIIGADEWKPTLQYYGIDRITIFYVVVGAIYWLTMARVVRGQVLSLKNEPFVEAARAIGVSQVSIIFGHILPNLFSIVIVYLTLTIPRVILFEAFLSFLGLGVEPPDVSWGLLANEGIQVITPVKVYWWLILFPSLAIGVTLFALNFLGDGLRDAFDPRLKNQ